MSFFVADLDGERIWQQQQQQIELAKLRAADGRPNTAGNLTIVSLA
jgi:hypothetical protein